MNLSPVASTNIAALGHDGSVLFVRFHTGQTYKFEGVPQDTFRQLSTAPSIGSYFQRFIRPAFKGVKVNDPV